MKKNNVKNNYVLYTISDEHLSEIVLEYNNIIKYKTNFTGDTAMYLEGDKKGYLLVDGRFAIQARNEIKNKKIKIVDINREYNLYDFLKGLCKKEKIDIYVDSKRESISKVERIKKCINGINSNINNKNNYNNIADVNSIKYSLNKNKNNINIKNINNNVNLYYIDNFDNKKFIDYRKNIFHMSSAPLFLLDKNDIKLFDKNTREVCTDNADVYITSSKEEIAYLTNLRYEFCDVENSGVLFDSFLIIYKNESYIYIHDYVDNDIEKLFYRHKIYIKEYNDFYKDIKNIKNKIVNIDKNINNYYIYQCLDKKNIHFIDSPFDNIMSIKTDTEIHNLKKTNIIDGICMVDVIYELKNNFKSFGKCVKEYDIKEYIDNRRRQYKNFLCPSFDTIVAFKENSAICHYIPTKKKSKKINEGVLLIDSGGHYKNGTTDITRTISLYKNVDKIPYDIIKHFTLVLKAMLNLQNQVFPDGYSGRELDLIARRDMYFEGLDFNHGTGHGIGYVTSVHLGPNVISSGIGNDMEKNILEINQVQSIEPGLYFDNKYGIRIENDTYVTHYKNTDYGEYLKFVPLTLCPIDKDLIDKSIMTDREIMWLNDYHSLVYKKLYKYYKGNKLKWLKRCCSKI